MTEQTKMLPIVERMLCEAANLEADIEPDHPNRDIYLARVAKVRADAKLIEALAEVVEYAHTTLVKQKIARHFTEYGFGGSATEISRIVNKLRAALTLTRRADGL